MRLFFIIASILPRRLKEIPTRKSRRDMRYWCGEATQEAAELSLLACRGGLRKRPVCTAQTELEVLIFSGDNQRLGYLFRAGARHGSCSGYTHPVVGRLGGRVGLTGFLHLDVCGLSYPLFSLDSQLLCLSLQWIQSHPMAVSWSLMSAWQRTTYSRNRLSVWSVRWRAKSYKPNENR